MREKRKRDRERGGVRERQIVRESDRCRKIERGERQGRERERQVGERQGRDRETETETEQRDIERSRRVDSAQANRTQQIAVPVYYYTYYLLVPCTTLLLGRINM